LVEGPYCAASKILARLLENSNDDGPSGSAIANSEKRRVDSIGSIPGSLAVETNMPGHLVLFDPERVKKATDALIDLGHYTPTLQREAAVFAETLRIDDGQRTLKLGRHVVLKLKKALDDIELMLPKK
jgi:hypothetical protein